MLQIKKRTIAVIIIAAMLLGVGLGWIAKGSPLFERVGLAGGGVYISQQQYDLYQGYVENYAKLEALRQYINSNYYTDVDQDALKEAMYAGIFDGLQDDYSYYIAADDYEKYIEDSTGKYAGVGALIQQTDNGVLVKRVYSDSPALNGGIKAGDIIIEIEGEAPADVEDASNRMRGEAGTEVSLKVFRDDEIIDFKLKRAEIVTDTIDYEMLDNNIAYIRIEKFSEGTAVDFKEALTRAEILNAESLIVDLRDNPGGLVNICIEIADELMEKGTLAYGQYNDGKKEYYTTTAGRTPLPFVLLINGDSASCSEILAAGIQDNGEAPLVGTVSFGKGIIQQTSQLIDGSAVKITIMQYFSPNGSIIHKKGITPDYIVELPDDAYNDEGEIIREKDTQLQKAIELLEQ